MRISRWLTLLRLLSLNNEDCSNARSTTGMTWIPVERVGWFPVNVQEGGMPQILTGSLPSLILFMHLILTKQKLESGNIWTKLTRIRIQNLYFFTEYHAIKHLILISIQFRRNHFFKF